MCNGDRVRSFSPSNKPFTIGSYLVAHVGSQKKNRLRARFKKNGNTKSKSKSKKAAKSLKDLEP